MSRSRMLLPAVPVGAVLIISSLGLAACSQDPAGGPGMGPGGGFPPAPVTFVEVQPESVLVQRDYAGRLHGSREAEVRVRVGGILEQRLYEEGSEVAEGAELFRIERAPYEIALRRAQAELANARAAEQQAVREWHRVSGLFEQGAISARERDRALSERELAEARLALADAGVAQARLDLGYTTVRAPIAGVTELETLTEGNLVSAGTLLTRVTQLDPVYVRFALPDADAAARAALASTADEQAAEVLAVRLSWPDGREYEHSGTVDFAASTLDAATGNVILRAVFPNPGRRLKPGALVRVRLAVERLDAAFLVDPEAVSQGTRGPIVYVVDEESTARARPVRLGSLVEGRQLITSGLQAGDRVIVNGQVAVHDGGKVDAGARDARSR